MNDFEESDDYVDNDELDDGVVGNASLNIDELAIPKNADSVASSDNVPLVNSPVYIQEVPTIGTNKTESLQQPERIVNNAEPVAKTNTTDAGKRIANAEQNSTEKNKTCVVPTNETKTLPELSAKNTIIASGSSVNGDITSKGAIIIAGSIVGNLDAEGPISILKDGLVNGSAKTKSNIDISGTVNNDVSATEVTANNAKVNGNITSAGSLDIKCGTIIIGNVSSKSAIISGAIKGDIDVTGPVKLTSTAIVKGNIKSESIQMDSGAVIDGVCSQCYAKNSPQSFFED